MRDLVLTVAISLILAGMVYGVMRLIGIGQCVTCLRSCSIFESRCRQHRMVEDDNELHL